VLFIDQLHFLTSCFLSLMSNNSVLEELRVRRFADIHEEISCKSILNASNMYLSQCLWDRKKGTVEYCLHKGDGLGKKRR